MAKTSLSVDPEVCTGCRACEMACGFHHSGEMGTGPSSIKIVRCNLTSLVRWSIDATCDQCREEAQPLCMKYCSVDAIAMETAS